MNNSIILIQRGITANVHPVSGKSGKLYGQAVFSPQHNGVIFKMSIDQYRDWSSDVVGNTLPGQQWVPEIVSEEQAKALPESRPVAPVRREEKPDVQPTIHDPEVDIAPIHAAAPVIGTEREHPTIAPPPPKPAPQVSQPAPPAAPAEATGPKEPTTMADRSGLSALIPPKKKAEEYPPAVMLIVDAVSQRIISELGPKLDAIAHMRNGAGKKTGKRRRVNETEFTALQKEARLLGINSYGKNTETLRAEIAQMKGG